MRRFNLLCSVLKTLASLKFHHHISKMRNKNILNIFLFACACSQIALATVEQSSPPPAKVAAENAKITTTATTISTETAATAKDSSTTVLPAAKASAEPAEKEQGKEKYLHSWDSGKKPPLSTLKMVCKDLSDLKTGDYVYITVQGKDEVYELAGTEFGHEGSVYKVERSKDVFSFKHPATSGFLFFTNPSYYIGVKKDSDLLEMFHNTEGQETAFNLLFHEKLNGFVMKNLTDGKCMSVGDKMFGHTPTFKKDQCAAVRFYKIPAYSLQKTNLPRVKPTDKTTKEEQLRKIKEEKEAVINTAKSLGRGQSTALAPSVAEQKAASTVATTSPPPREVKLIKKVIVHKKPHKEPLPAADSTCTVTASPATTIVPVCKCMKADCTCGCQASSTQAKKIVSSTISTTCTATETAKKSSTCLTSTAVVVVVSPSKFTTSTVSNTVNCTSTHNATKTTSFSLFGFLTSTIVTVKPSTVIVFSTKTISMTKTINMTKTATTTNAITKTSIFTSNSTQTSVLTSVVSVTSTCLVAPAETTRVCYSTETIEA